MKDLTFNISETSKITGLSIDTLRYYDKIGLIESKKNPNNRYRYYTIGDISIINHIKNLRDLDLSIHDIKLLLHSNTEVQHTILKNHHKVLLEKVASLKKIEKVFKDTLKEVNSSNLMINVPVVKSYNERYFKKLTKPVKTDKCCISKKNLLDTSHNFLEVIDKFVFSFYGKGFDSVGLFDFFELGRITENQEYYTEISADEFELNKDSEDILVIPQSNYIETITKLSKDNFDEYFENLIEWVNYKNLNPIYPGFIKYLDTSLYFINEGECLIKFQIPFTHKKYE
ncbi:MAG: MerR family transcriptional regulator [Intestinibacter bartlettii]|uniref:MerR family transcriptional regulator n=1 Tax=Intestinibacter bartlettii TaxID=261299 RepID=UPI0026F2A768|nr:MerR family transcriptional regulator [Intestinibacter bartlettii]MDO5010277.1 MerR family transcriptional regulator [Intestinibacter bartlettii]